MARTTKVDRQNARLAEEGLPPTATPNRLQLKRLIAQMKIRGVTVELRKKADASMPRIVVIRAEHKEVVFKTSHTMEYTLELISDLAHASVETGGAGMTWTEIRSVCHTPNPTVDNKVEPRDVSVPTVRKGGSTLGKTPRGEGSVAQVWRIASENSTLDRKTVIDLCLKAGINIGTAQKQYGLWKKSQQGGSN